ncbi:hypothetical protein AMTR_s00035p00225400 [Amborella trichopoda]|uniref:Uncharacterized protein n=1 Tax=Amborella trichopoda TaxID=13333 RepID=W1PXD9_AMBTC|nr:hypothetical protein AMTR_s00035p00225400 [Amborella trichopoda]
MSDEYWGGLHVLNQRWGLKRVVTGCDSTVERGSHESHEEKVPMELWMMHEMDGDGDSASMVMLMVECEFMREVMRLSGKRWRNEGERFEWRKLRLERVERKLAT